MVNRTRPGRIVLITGAAAGIGLASAHAFAAAGDIVWLADVNGEEAMRQAAALGSPHAALALDVAD